MPEAQPGTREKKHQPFEYDLDDPPANQRLGDGKQNFTPGPWLVNTSPHHDSGKPWTIWTSRGPGYGAVAHLAPWCPPGTSREEEQKVADAHLIAAAPDLFEALDRIVGNCRDADCGDHCSNACMFCQARAALDKAIGKGQA